MKENKTIEKNKMKRADELYKFYNLTSFCLFVFLLKEENNKKSESYIFCIPSYNILRAPPGS